MMRFRISIAAPVGGLLHKRTLGVALVVLPRSAVECESAARVDLGGKRARVSLFARSPFLARAHRLTRYPLRAGPLLDDPPPCPG